MKLQPESVVPGQLLPTPKSSLPLLVLAVDAAFQHPGRAEGLRAAEHDRAALRVRVGVAAAARPTGQVVRLGRGLGPAHAGVHRVRIHAPQLAVVRVELPLALPRPEHAEFARLQPEVAAVDVEPRAGRGVAAAVVEVGDAVHVLVAHAVVLAPERAVGRVAAHVGAAALERDLGLDRVLLLFLFLVLRLHAGEGGKHGQGQRRAAELADSLLLRHDVTPMLSGTGSTAQATAATDCSSRGPACGSSGSFGPARCSPC